MVVFGFLLFFVNGCVCDSDCEFNRKNWREIEFKVIDIMVCFMGIIGFVFWFMKVLYCCLWVYKYVVFKNIELIEYFVWTILKDFSYVIIVIF